MEICFDGIGQVAATFQVTGSGVEPGMAVMMKDSGTVGLGTGLPCGVVLSAPRGGAAAVQIGGVARVAYSGTAPAVGWQALSCDGAGGVKTVEKDGLSCLVLAVDETEETVVVRL